MRRPALWHGGLVLSVALCSFALLAPIAAGRGAAGVRQQAAPPETAAQCFTKLRQLVGALAKLDQLADQVKGGKVYLFSNGRVYYPIDKGKYETFIAAEGLIATGSPDIGGLAEFAQRSTAKTLKKLLVQVDDGHNLVQAREKRCNDLKNGTGGSATTATTGSEAGLTLTITLDMAQEAINLKTNTLTPAEGSPGASIQLKSGSSYDGTAKVTGGELPAGYIVYIEFHSQIWAVLSPAGGSFSVAEAAGFAAGNDVTAAACVNGGHKGDPALPTTCLGGAVITLNWTA